VGKLSDWKLVHKEPLGKGGQSEVFLVRRPERTNLREASFELIRQFGGQDLHRSTSEGFAVALSDVARADDPWELAALKKFVPRGSDPRADQSALGRLKNEIDVLQRKHAGFLKLLDSNVDEGWIVTEYCVHGTLESNLSKYKGNAQASLSALVPVIRAVADLHQDGIVHRDIKPQNIFIGEDGKLLLGDFGLVFLPDQAERLSITGESVGPRDFMPPWVFLGPQPPKINQAFDVYMLGKVLWCMVSGNVKLHREDFLEPELDLTNLFPGDPNMHAINMILKKCVVARERDCLGAAGDLWLMAGKIAQITSNGAQLLNDGIPRPCRVCGDGEYLPEQPMDGQPLPTSSLSFTRIVTTGMHTTGQPAKGMRVEAFVCNKCRHVQFFKAGEM
jgi:serine/threonine protein kinase